ncbi:MAG: murein biosynthesis integral membrane protein MurJ, partial [Elusimicrobia bacterium]|nr:murein biosynthesis integral membrane protein MurJ [Elusimicrobiota bacterium]
MKDSGKHHKFTRSLSAFGSATLISRVLGYLRDAAVAAYFGGGYQTDAFYAAFKIPNLLRRFLGEGSLTAAFVPVFTGTLHKKGKEEAARLYDAVLTGLLAVLAVCVVLGIIFAPQVTQIVSWGFVRDPEVFRLTTQLTRLTFPFLLLICVAALMTAVLNSCGRFFVPAVAPSGLSIGEILFIVFLASRTKYPIQGLAVAAVVGVGIHLIWQVPAMRQEGYRFKIVNPLNHPEVKTVLFLMIPTIIGLCADQVNSFVDQFCASFLKEGSITALYNSNRVMQLPLALFGVAVASVALPALSHTASEENMHDFKEMLGFSIRIANYVLIPSFVGLAAIGVPIVKLLFQHGHFKPEYTLMTYQAMVGFSVGLPAYSATRIFASAFYARKNTKTPVRIAFQAMTVNAILDFALMWKYTVGGLAFATSAAGWYQAVVLFWMLRKELGLLGGREIIKSFVFSSVAGLVMGLLCYGLTYMVLTKLPLALNVLISITVGSAFYLSVSKLLKV